MKMSASTAPATALKGLRNFSRCTQNRISSASKKPEQCYIQVFYFLPQVDNILIKFKKSSATSPPASRKTVICLQA